MNLMEGYTKYYSILRFWGCGAVNQHKVTKTWDEITEFQPESFCWVQTYCRSQKCTAVFAFHQTWSLKPWSFRIKMVMDPKIQKEQSILNSFVIAKEFCGKKFEYEPPSVLTFRYPQIDTIMSSELHLLHLFLSFFPEIWKLLKRKFSI